jgi:hypothetical protein
MRKTWIKLLSAVLVMAALTALVLSEPQLTQDSPGQSFKLTTLSPNEVVSITLTQANKAPITLKRVAASQSTSAQTSPASADSAAAANNTQIWLMTAPLSARANPVRAAAIASLAGALSNIAYDSTDLELAKFGLVPPKIQLTLNDIVIAIGARQELDDLRYLMRDGQVLLMQDRFYHHLNKSPPGYIDPALFADDAKLIAIHTDSFEARMSEGSWTWQPASAFKSADEVVALAAQWRLASATEVRMMDYQLQWSDTVRVEIQGRPPIRLMLARDNNRTWLGRPDTDLQYALTQQRARTLLRQQM